MVLTSTGLRDPMSWPIGQRGVVSLNTTVQFTATNYRKSVSSNSERCLKSPHITHPFPPVDIVSAMMIFWRIREKIISTFCAVLCMTVVHGDMHTRMSSS